MEIHSHYKQADLAEMARLSLENYGGDNDISNVAFLQWQYLDNPAGEAYVSVARDGERLIGEIAQIPLRFRVEGREVIGANYVNALINKSDRALALFYKLHKASFDLCEQLAFCFSVPNPHSHPLFLKLFKCVTVAQIPLLVLPMRPRGLTKKMIHKTLGIFVPDLVYKGLPMNGRGAEIIEYDPEKDAQKLDVFWHTVQDKYKILGVRDSKLFSWRYFKNPIRSYKVFLSVDKGEVTGFIALRIMEVDGVKNGMAVDFLVRPGAEKSAKALLKKAIRYFSSEKCELCGCLMLSHAEEYKYIKRAGFLPCPEKFLPQPFPLTIKITDKANQDAVLTPENWFITMGDYDVV